MRIDGRGVVQDRPYDSAIINETKTKRTRSSALPSPDHPGADFIGRLFMRVCFWVDFLTSLREKQN
jgi:hypothetical protein